MDGQILIHSVGSVKWFNHFGKLLSASLSICLPQDPAISIPGMCPLEMCSCVQKNTRTRVSTQGFIQKKKKNFPNAHQPGMY